MLEQEENILISKDEEEYEEYERYYKQKHQIKEFIETIKAYQKRKIEIYADQGEQKKQLEEEYQKEKFLFLQMNNKTKEIKEIKGLIRELSDQEKEVRKEKRDIRQIYTKMQKEIPTIQKKEILLKELQKQMKQYKELEQLEKKQDNFKASKERLLQKQEELRQKQEKELQKEKQFMEFLKKADEIEKQYDQLQKKEINVKLEVETLLELCKEKDTYYAQLDAYEKERKNYEEIRIQRRKLKDQLSDWQDQYDRNQAGLLARTLTKGKACPVCGSIQHPMPATFKESDITQEMLKDLRVKTEKIDQAYNTVFAKVKQIKGIVETLEESLCKKSGKSAHELRELDILYEQKMQQYKGIKKDYECSLKQKEKVADFRSKVERSKEKQQSFVNKIQEMTKKIHEKDIAWKQTEAKTEEIHKHLQYASFEEAKEVSSNLETQIMTLQNDLKQVESKNERIVQKEIEIKATMDEKQKALEDTKIQLADMKSSMENFEDLKKFESKLHRKKREIQKQNDRLEQLNKRISINEQSLKFMEKKLSEYEQAEINYTLLKDLSDTANGEQKGKMKISFERYVQSVYFDLVLIAANKRLSVMSEGRYYLLRKEENENKKTSTGLDLEILDEWTGKKRNIRSLSGGESFKAALSLALGLSDVIQNKKGGIMVDTIFIDEGFGTLDGDSLNKAMQIIHDLSFEGNKLVGIISHVEELKEQIDQKIEVYKDHTGSKIK